jgi:iron complex outermembrane receptor protein
VGANGNRYARDHYAFVRPDLATPLYFNTGHKGDVSGFTKIAYDIGRATLFGDLQARHAQFRYAPDGQSGIRASAIDWTFVNPKVGITYQLTGALRLYASYGRNSREPARNDMFAGFDNLDTSNVAFVGDLGRVRPETVHDVEAGVTARTAVASFQGNLFSMDFRNEIAPIGALSYLGLPLRKNVRASFRRGVELDGTYRIAPRATVAANLTLMRARIAEYTDDATGLTYRDVPPLLTPAVTTAQRIQLDATRRLSFAIEGRYTGKSQLDNTGDLRLTLPAAYLVDATASWRQGRVALTLRGNNLTNSKRFGSGYAGGATPYYYVLPPRNLFGALSLEF